MQNVYIYIKSFSEKWVKSSACIKRICKKKTRHEILERQYLSFRLEHGGCLVHVQKYNLKQDIHVCALKKISPNGVYSRRTNGFHKH